MESEIVGQKNILTKISADRFIVKTFFPAALLGFILTLITAIIILCCVPPVSRDELSHHLAVPKLYVNHGGIYEIPSISFSYYPMNLEMLYLIPLYWGNDIIPKFIHFLFALLTAGFIFSYLKRRADISFALLGVLFFLSIPIIVQLSITAYVDLGLIFFSTASLIFLLKWIEHAFKLRYLILSAVCCGLSLGTKYNALVVLLLLTFFIPFIYSRASQRTRSNQFKAIGYGVIFLTVAGVLFSPWMIKNYMWTGNPLYPLFITVFTPPVKIPATMNSEPLKSLADMGPFVFRSVVFKEQWYEIALTPFRIFFQGQDGSPKFFDGKLNPFLLLLPGLAFFNIKKNPALVKTEKNIFLSFAVLYLLFVFFYKEMRIRWIAPIIPPLVILSILGLKEIQDHFTNRYRRFPVKKITGVVLFAGLIPVFMNTVYLFGQFRHVDPLSYLSGKVGREEYIEKNLPEYPVIRYVNENLPHDAKILGVFMGFRQYYYNREVYFRDFPFQINLAHSNPSASIFNDLYKEGVTHLIINYDIFNNWANRILNDSEKKTIQEFRQKHLRLLYSKGEFRLYQIE